MKTDPRLCEHPDRCTFLIAGVGGIAHGDLAPSAASLHQRVHQVGIARLGPPARQTRRVRGVLCMVAEPGCIVRWGVPGRVGWVGWALVWALRSRMGFPRLSWGEASVFGVTADTVSSESPDRLRVDLVAKLREWGSLRSPEVAEAFAKVPREKFAPRRRLPPPTPSGTSSSPSAMPQAGRRALSACHGFKPR
jgi:hypothetical protein